MGLDPVTQGHSPVEARPVPGQQFLSPGLLREERDVCSDKPCPYSWGLWGRGLLIVWPGVRGLCPETLRPNQLFASPWGSGSEKVMTSHSSTFAWKIPQTEEPGRLQSMGSRRVGHD